MSNSFLISHLHTCELILKPWKGRVSKILFVVDTKKNIDEQVDKQIESLKSEGKYKGRTVTHYVVPLMYCKL